MNIVRFSHRQATACFTIKKSANHAPTQGAPWAPPSRSPFSQVGHLALPQQLLPLRGLYTLDSVAQYDPLGLWSYRDIHFSRQRHAVDTAASLVTQAPAGYVVHGIGARGAGGAKDALRQLTQAGRLSRRSGKDGICTARWTGRDDRSSGPHGRPSNNRATMWRRPRRVLRPAG